MVCRALSVHRMRPGLDVIEACARRKLGCAHVLAYGQHWHASPERDGMVYQDETGPVGFAAPCFAGRSPDSKRRAWRWPRCAIWDAPHDAACTAAVTQATWPARMQRLRMAPPCLTWQRKRTLNCGLMVGTIPAAGLALGRPCCAACPNVPTHLICGMLNTKDVRGYLAPLLAGVVDSLTALSIPGEAATLSAADTAQAAHATWGCKRV